MVENPDDAVCLTQALIQIPLYVNMYVPDEYVGIDKLIKCRDAYGEILRFFVVQ